MGYNLLLFFESGKIELKLVKQALDNNSRCHRDPKQYL